MTYHGAKKILLWGVIYRNVKQQEGFAGVQYLAQCMLNHFLKCAYKMYRSTAVYAI